MQKLAASSSGGMARRLVARAGGAVGLGAATAVPAASSRGGVAQLAWPVPSQRQGGTKIRNLQLAASSCGGRLVRHLAWRQVPRVGCRACRHSRGGLFCHLYLQVVLSVKCVRQPVLFDKKLYDSIFPSLLIFRSGAN